MTTAHALTVKDVWNSINPEEKFDCIEQAQAHGFLTALAFGSCICAIAYGFDYIYLLVLAGLSVVLLSPLATLHSWRKSKPELMLHYLAAQVVGRRYAFNLKFSDLSTMMIFRGVIDREVEVRHASSGKTETETEELPVWICLLRGGVLVMSESRDGARIEFYGRLDQELSCKMGGDATKKANKHEPLTVELSAVHRIGKTQVTLRGKYQGALYVFERKLNQLIAEAQDKKRITSL